MISLPETKYARSGDISMAYQVMGEGPLDFVAGCERILRNELERSDET